MLQKEGIRYEYRKVEVYSYFLFLDVESLVFIQKEEVEELEILEDIGDICK